MKPLIELDNVNKIYHLGKVKVPALKYINLKIKKGERVAIMGPSGCGKSTLLHISGCLDRPTSGKIFIDGQDISKLGDDQLANIRKNKIGFVFQFFNLLPTLTAFENVRLPMMFNNIHDHKKDERVKELLRAVGLGDRMQHKPTELSGGEQQRVAIARAMVNNPPIIFADEPTGNLDSKSGEEVMRVLTNLNKEYNTTLVIVTHEPDISKHAERIINLKDGEIIKEVRR